MCIGWGIGYGVGACAYFILLYIICTLAKLVCVRHATVNMYIITIHNNLACEDIIIMPLLFEKPGAKK